MLCTHLSPMPWYGGMPQTFWRWQGTRCSRTSSCASGSLPVGHTIAQNSGHPLPGSLWIDERRTLSPQENGASFEREHLDAHYVCSRYARSWPPGSCASNATTHAMLSPGSCRLIQQVLSSTWNGTRAPHFGPREQTWRGSRATEQRRHHRMLLWMQCTLAERESGGNPCHARSAEDKIKHMTILTGGRSTHVYNIALSWH